MILEEAYRITSDMKPVDHTNQTDLRREAKHVIFDQIIRSAFGSEAPAWAEPDYLEGWKTI